MKAARRRVMALAIVAVTMIVAACGQSGATAPGHVTIAFTLVQTGNQYYGNAQLGAEAAGLEDGNARVVVQGPSNPTATNMTTIAENLEISLGPDGFATSPCILDAWTRLLNSLPTQVPRGNVLAWNCKPVTSPTATSPVKTYVGANDLQSAVGAVRGAVEAAGLGPDTTGTAVVAQCQAGVTILDQRATGALAEVKRLLPKANAVHLVTNALQGPNTTAWASAFAKYDDVVFAIGACDQDSMSLSTLKERGVGGDFVMGVFDAMGRQLQLIKDGKIDAALSTRPWVIANVATALLIRGARGTPLPEGWVDTGREVITKDNVDEWIAAERSPEAARAFYGPMARQILADLEANTHPMTDAFEE